MVICCLGFYAVSTIFLSCNGIYNKYFQSADGTEHLVCYEILFAYACICHLNVFQQLQSEEKGSLTLTTLLPGASSPGPVRVGVIMPGSVPVLGPRHFLGSFQPCA